MPLSLPKITNMKSRISIILLLIINQLVASAQLSDSVIFVNATWKSDKIGPKTKLKTIHFKDSSLFNANQFLSLVEVKNPGKRVVLEVAADAKTLHTTSTFANNSGAFVALNGTFFDIKNGGSVDFVKHSGEVINITKLGDNNLRSAHQKAAVTSHKGKVAIQKWDGNNAWESAFTEDEVMVSGPLLIFNEKYESLDNSSFTQARHPRTVVGLKRDGSLILLTVDGRQANSAGMSLPELSKVMKWLGCVSAINLDGGGSTTLWTEKGVVNHPSDNKLWDNQGERKVANVLVLKRK